MLTGNFVRKLFVVVSICIAWEAYALFVDNDLLFPRMTETAYTLWAELSTGNLIVNVGNSMQTLLIGYVSAVAISFVITTMAISNSLAREYLNTITSILNPLPAVALLPLALLWFGVGPGAILFVIINSVLWPLSLNILSGFNAVPTVLRMVGRNYGIKGPRYVLSILIPAALPSIVAGLKISWAFAWRSLLAAELIFGVSSGGGGIGWYIFEKKNQLEISAVFGGLLAVIIIGLIMEYVVFRALEAATVQRWGAVNDQT
nr:ABC transporter permease subunit [uncultured Devosia sp.]